MLSTFSSATSHHFRAHSPTPGSVPDVPAQGAGSPADSANVPSTISRMWAALQNMRRPPLKFAAIAVNGTGVGCIDNDSIIKVVKSGAVAEGQACSRKDVQIHAHEVAIKSSVDGQDKKRHYAVGQSPPDDTCLNAVLQGVNSGQGLFQFVSRKAHRDGVDKSGETMSRMLQRLLDDAHGNGQAGVPLDERYTLTKIEIDNGIDEGGTATRFNLIITESKTEVDKLPEMLHIPLMQAGLKFSGKLLRVDEIQSASALMGPCTTPSTSAGVSDAQSDPLILSTAGHGRNAVLMTYREIVRQIDEKIVKTDAGLKKALEAVISQGREIRSPHFVHSEKQLAELYAALKAYLPAQVRAVLPGAGAKAHSLRTVTVNAAAPVRASSTSRLTRRQASLSAVPSLRPRLDDRYESREFPDKTLSASTIKNMGPKKAALFEKQNALVAKHRSQLDASGSMPPLKAFFSKKETVAAYRKGTHLKTVIGQRQACIVRSAEGFYFTSQQAPSPDVVDVHVDFANASLGGAWMDERAFAQEEVAFIENAGLAVVACFAQRKNLLTREGINAPAPILIEGAERVAHFRSYGGRAANMSKSQLVADENFEITNPCLSTNWLAIAAPDARGKVTGNSWKGASEKEIRSAFEDIFSTAHAGFTMAKTVGEGKALRINTGQFGCGVFSNSLAISTAAQMLAAKLVGVEEIVFHDYSKANKDLFIAVENIVSEKLAAMDPNTGTVQDAINAILQSKRFRNLI
jgi:hypothetical protein